MNLKEIGWLCVGWIRLAQGAVRWRAVVKTVMKVCVSLNS
jgi:hypothetical protein